MFARCFNFIVLSLSFCFSRNIIESLSFVSNRFNVTEAYFLFTWNISILYHFLHCFVSYHSLLLENSLQLLFYEIIIMK